MTRTLSSLALCALLFLSAPVAQAQDGLTTVPAPPALRQLGERQGQRIGRAFKSANVKTNGTITLIELAYEGGFRVEMARLTPELLQVGIGLIGADPGELGVTLFAEEANGNITGLTLIQADVPDAEPLSTMPPSAVLRFFRGLEAESSDSPQPAKTAFACASWKATDATAATDADASASVVIETPRTQGTFAFYANLFRVVFAFGHSQGYQVETTAAGHLRASRDASTQPRTANFVELYGDSAGNDGVVLTGYDASSARAMRAYLLEILHGIEEHQGVALLAAEPQPSVTGEAAASAEQLEGILQALR